MSENRFEDDPCWGVTLDQDHAAVRDLLRENAEIMIRHHPRSIKEHAYISYFLSALAFAKDFPTHEERLDYINEERRKQRKLKRDMRPVSLLAKEFRKTHPEAFALPRPEDREPPVSLPPDVATIEQFYDAALEHNERQLVFKNIQRSDDWYEVFCEVLRERIERTLRSP